MAKRKRPAVCVDEHLPPELKDCFRERGLKAIEAARTKGYAGEDEDDYLLKLYARNEVFITGDEKFVDRVLAARPKHAGIVWVPTWLTRDEKEYFWRLAAQYISLLTKDSRFGFRGNVIYPGNDGMRMVNQKGIDTLELSWTILDIVGRSNRQ